jgi:hypothetical protein
LKEKRTKKERRRADLSTHALFHEGTQLALVLDLDQLLRAIGRVGDIELHLVGREKRAHSQQDEEGGRRKGRGGRTTVVSKSVGPSVRQLVVLLLWFTLN